MKKVLQNYTFAQTAIGGASDSEILDLNHGQDKPGGFAFVSNITVNTNSAKTWVSAAVGTNTITLTAHGYITGVVGQMTTSGGLPTGLSTSTNYYVIVIDANTVSFATSYANAIAGTVITFTATGDSGTGTFTPTALSGATVVAKWSVDQIVWVSVGSPTSITTATVFSYEKDRPAWRYLKITYALTAGSLTVGQKLMSYSD